MNEMAGVRKKLGQSLGQDLPDSVWGVMHIQGLAGEYLEADTNGEREQVWGDLEEGVKERLKIWNDGREESLRGVRSGTLGGTEDMREAGSRDSGNARGLGADWSASGRTEAMTRAMSALFALIGDQVPEVKEFRKKVLPGRFLAAGEAHSLIASPAARIFDLRLFEKWNIPFIGHEAALVEHDTGSGRGGIYGRATVQVDPPGITKTVRYVDVYNSLEEEDVADTRALTQSGAIIPLIDGLPVEGHGDYVYPSWLWPGSVVDNLYELSVKLAGHLDWPLASIGNLTETRPRSESAAWFILTGEAPPVRPIKAIWEGKSGIDNLNPQWRIQLTIPPWLPEEEVLQAFRALRRQRPVGRQMPKTAKPLDVARFVWEREKLDGYREPAPWTEWVERWNEEHPGHRFKTASNFRTYFLRGDRTVKHLNFDWPNFERER